MKRKFKSPTLEDETHQSGLDGTLMTIKPLTVQMGKLRPRAGKPQ